MLHVFSSKSIAIPVRYSSTSTFEYVDTTKSIGSQISQGFGSEQAWYGIL